MVNLYKKGIFALSLMFGLSAQAQFPEPYCSVTFTTGIEPITLVNFAGINHPSSATIPGGLPLEDFTAIVGNVMAGETYPITVNGNTDGPFTNYFRVFVDWDQNGLFDDGHYDLGTINGNDGSGPVLESSIAVPLSAVAGTTRMRVMKRFNAYSTDACQIGAGYGQAEDYTLSVTPATDCTGAPSVGAATASVTTVCGGTPFTLSADVTFAGGLTFQWEVSVDGGNSWTALGAEQTSVNYTVANQSVASSYRLNATCTFSGESTVSSAVTVGQNEVEDCYCINDIDMNCTDGDVILNVSFGSMTNPSGCGDMLTGYSDYQTSVAPATVDAGEIVPISVTVGPSGGGWLFESVGVWIDYNKNGVFEEDEFTDLGTGINETLSGNIEIPATALNGATRMRVIVFAMAPENITWEMSCGPTDPLNNFGEMEDYTLVINNLSAPSFNAAQLSVYPNPTNGIVNLKFGQATNISSVSVYSVSGRLVHSQSWNNVSDSYEMNLQNLSEGIYMVKVDTPQGSITKKLIKN